MVAATSSIVIESLINIPIELATECARRHPSTIGREEEPWAIVVPMVIKAAV